MPPPQNGRTCFFLTPYLRTVGGWLSLLGLSLLITVTRPISASSGLDHGASALHPNPLCQGACSRADPSVSSSPYPFVRDKLQLQNTGETNPQQRLHWHPPKYLWQPVRNSCSVHFLLGDALACVPITEPGSDTQPCAAPCMWQGDRELGLTPRNLFLNWLCCIT